jgi:hypothetical protein
VDISTVKKDRRVMITRKVPGKATKSAPSSAAREKVSVSLPSQKSIPSTDLGNYSMLLYGMKKIGKTSLASKFPEAIFLMTEPGAKALSVYQVSVKSWAEFKGYVKLLSEDEKFQTVVVDIVDNLYAQCFEYVCQKLAIEHPSEEKWGKGWGDIKKEFITEIMALAQCGKGIIFVSHAMEKEVKQRNGDSYHMIAPTMANQAKEVLEGLVDIWAYYTYENKERVLVIKGSDHIGAGHRIENKFRYTDGTAVEEISMGKSAGEAHKNFVKAFSNELTKPKTTEGGTDKGEQEKKAVRVTRK